MTDPLTTALAAALSGPVADAVVERLQAAQTSTEADAARESLRTDLDPWRAYTVRDAAQWLGLTPKALYAIPDDELPPIHTGAARGRRAYYGINLLCYAHGLEPVDTAAVARAIREEFMRSMRPPAVRPLHQGERMQIL